MHIMQIANFIVSSVKDMFIESLNARKVMRVSMVNPFQLNGMEPKAFYYLNNLQHSGTGSTV